MRNVKLLYGPLTSSGIFTDRCMERLGAASRGTDLNVHAGVNEGRDTDPYAHRCNCTGIPMGRTMHKQEDIGTHLHSCTNHNKQSVERHVAMAELQCGCFYK